MRQSIDPLVKPCHQRGDRFGAGQPGCQQVALTLCGQQLLRNRAALCLKFRPPRFQRGYLRGGCLHRTGRGCLRGTGRGCLGGTGLRQEQPLPKATDLRHFERGASDETP